jgi:transcriptional regulator NrdR family protein
MKGIIMATVKENVLQMIKELPDDITLEDIMYHLYAREKIIRGLKDADEGRKVSNEKAKEVIEKWFE